MPQALAFPVPPLLLLLAATAAPAQPVEAPAEPERLSLAGAAELRGAAIPDYLVVERFYLLANRLRQRGDDSYEGLLRAIGIDPHGPDATTLTATVEEAAAVASLPVLDPASVDGASPEEFLASQRRMLRTKAAGLGRLHRRLLDELAVSEGVGGGDAAGGGPAQALCRFIAERVRPGMVVWATRGEPEVAELRATLSAFDEALDRSPDGR